MSKPVFLLAVLTASLAACRPEPEPEVLSARPVFCTFSFEACYPVDPCEGPDFALQELLVIDGEGLYLETSRPHSKAEALATVAPLPGCFLSQSLLDGQYHPPGSPHFIIIPIPPDDPFWSCFEAAADAGAVLWSGKINYPCWQESDGKPAGPGTPGGH